MNKSSRKEGRGRKKNGVSAVSVLMLVLAFLVSAGSVTMALTPKRYVLAQGDVAEETITAPRAVVDEGTTQALRAAAGNGVAAVYVVDEAIYSQYYGRAEAFFSHLSQVRAQAAQLLGEEQAGQWDKLTSDQIVTLCQMTAPALTGDQFTAVLAASDSDLLRLSELVLPKVLTTLKNGLAEENVERMQDACKQELNATTLPQGLKSAGEAVIEAFVQATYVEDAAATQAARALAAAAVEPVEIRQGQVIVEKDTVVTVAQMQILEELELIREPNSDLRLAAGVSLYLALLYLALAAYLLLYRRETIENTRKMVMLGIIVSLTMLLALLTNSINTHITPGLIAVILTALLVCERTALAVNVVMALSIGAMAGGRGSGLLQVDSMLMTASMLFAGFAAVVALRKANRRSTLITAGLVGGAAGAVGMLALCIMLGRDILPTLEDMGWALGSSAVSGVLCVGTLSIWESVFDVPTVARLNELSNVNHPLLRQLMTEAPGTYHHSLMTASLAEAAAQRIGADAALARVGAYFHDVGKLRRPLYFGENQRPGENIHDTLPAAESVIAIIAHQKDSGLLLSKHRLPSAVIQIALEHHGTTLVSYFYHKAVEEAKGGTKSVNEKHFRYPGPKPSTRESAIVMLADSCEAAVRSLPPDTPREQVEEMIRRVVAGKLDDGQLARTQLTLFELNEIQKSFLKTIGGIRHERVEYPENNRGKEDG